MKKKHSTKKDEYYKLDKKTIGYGILAVALIVVLVVLYSQGMFDTFLPEKEAKTADKETAEMKTKVDIVPEVKLTVITADCEKCINASLAAKIIKEAPILKIVDEEFIEYDSEEGKTLVAKYNITRLPAFILRGKNIEFDLPTFDKKQDALVFSNTPAPYFDVASGEPKGIVDVIKVVDPDCEDCFDIEMLANNLKAFGIVFDEEKTVAFDSQEGKEVILKYDIKSLPTVIFSGDAMEYEQISSIWETVGSTEEDGMMVLRQVNPPYLDVDSGDVKGIVDITYLVDESCEKCYDPQMLKDMFIQQLAMKFGTENKVDVSSDEGKDLIEAFEIQYIPTIIMSSDAGEYPGITSIWDQVGAVKDSQYALTKLDVAQGVVYKDLESGEIIGLPEGEELEETEAEEGSEGNETA